MANIIRIGGGGGSSAVLVSKTITANGTYLPAADHADGYSDVTVNVSGSSAVDIIPLRSNNAFFSTSNITGTNISAVGRTWTFDTAGTIRFNAETYGRTNTGSNDGYFDIQLNGVSVKKQYLISNTDTDIAVDDIQVAVGDTLDIVYGFDNYHSRCEFSFYSSIDLLVDISYVKNIKLNDGLLTVGTGAITADSDYCYSDPFPCPMTTAFFDVGEVDSDLGIAIYDTNGVYTECFTANERNRTVDIANYISDPTGYTCRLSFAKANIGAVCLRDNSAEIMYAANTPAVLGEEHYQWGRDPLPEVSYDPWDFWRTAASGRTARTNFSFIWSDYVVVNSRLVEAIETYINCTSGYEGVCFNIDARFPDLVSGNNYVFTCTLDVATTVTFQQSYNFGLKYSTTLVTNFNTTVDQSLTRQTGAQAVSFSFTAGADNFISLIASACGGSGLIRFIDVKIEEAT